VCSKGFFFKKPKPKQFSAGTFKARHFPFATPNNLHAFVETLSSLKRSILTILSNTMMQTNADLRTFCFAVECECLSLGVCTTEYKDRAECFLSDSFQAQNVERRRGKDVGFTLTRCVEIVPF
jgi:hypothetical protein